VYWGNTREGFLTDETGCYLQVDARKQRAIVGCGFIGLQSVTSEDLKKG